MIPQKHDSPHLQPLPQDLDTLAIKDMCMFVANLSFSQAPLDLGFVNFKHMGMTGKWQENSQLKQTRLS